MTRATSVSFEPLTKLFHGDADKIRRIVGIFERVTRGDLEQLDQAYASRDWAAIGKLAHKMKSGCMQLGETAAAAGLTSIERSLAAPDNDAFAQEFAAARNELDCVMVRVAEYLGTNGEGSGDSHRPAKVLIADDHPIIVFALAEMLKDALDNVQADSVPDGDSLLRCLEAESWDYLVLDLHMPGRLKSVSLLQTILTMQPGLRVVVYTGADHPCLAQAALEFGARAYVSKSSGPEVAIEAIRAAFAGTTYVDPAVDVSAATNHPWYQLTSGERAVLIALARGEHLQAIAIDSNRSYKTVTAHKYNAFRKLGLKSKADIGHYLAHHGLGFLIE